MIFFLERFSSTNSPPHAKKYLFFFPIYCFCPSCRGNCLTFGNLNAAYSAWQDLLSEGEKFFRHSFFTSVFSVLELKLKITESQVSCAFSGSFPRYKLWNEQWRKTSSQQEPVKLFQIVCCLWRTDQFLLTGSSWSFPFCKFLYQQQQQQSYSEGQGNKLALVKAFTCTVRILH